MTCHKAVRSVVQQPHLVDPIIPTRSNVNAVALAGIDPVEGPSRCDKHTRRLSGARRRACRGRVARSRKLALAASTLLHSVPGPPMQHTRAHRITLLHASRGHVSRHWWIPVIAACRPTPRGLSSSRGCDTTAGTREHAGCCARCVKAGAAQYQAPSAPGLKLWGLYTLCALLNLTRDAGSLL